MLKHTHMLSFIFLLIFLFSKPISSAWATNNTSTQTTTMTCCPNIVPNGSFEEYPTSFTFPLDFNGNPAEAAQPNDNIANSWTTSTADTGNPTWLIDDTQDAVNNTDGDYFIYVKGQYDCVELQGFICENGPLEQDITYELCFDAATWNQTMNGDNPATPGTQADTEVIVDVAHNDGSNSQTAATTITASSSWNTLNWTRVCYDLLFTTNGQRIAGLQISQEGSGGFVLDNVVLKRKNETFVPVPIISVTNNVCDPVAAGSFNIDSGCGTGAHIEWSMDGGTNWTTGTPTYDNSTPITVISRCVDDTGTACESGNSSAVTSVPADCNTTNCNGDGEAQYGCGDGPGGCNVVVESYMIDIPRDSANGDRPITPFSYTIPNNPTNGQFQVIVRYRTRAGAGAEANGVDFNGTTGTPFSLAYGSNANHATNFEATFTTGDIATLTLDIDSDPVDADNLPGLEILVFKCDGASTSSYSYTSPNEFIWVNAPDVGSNPYCVTRTLCLPESNCEAGNRDLLITNGIFNIHQDQACDRQFVMEYTSDIGEYFTFTETPPENNSTYVHTINVGGATTSLDISLCTWYNNNNPNANWAIDCSVGVSTGWANTVVEDKCACSTTAVCTNPVIDAIALAASCTNGTPNDDGTLQINAATDATHYNYTMGSDYTAGDTDIANATPFNPSTDLPLSFGTLSNPTGSQDYTIRVFNGTSDCFTDVVITLNEQVCSATTDCNNLSILYLCGDNKYADGYAWDHGMVQYLEAMNGPNTVSAFFTKNSGTGLGLYDPEDINTQITTDVTTYDCIFISNSVGQNFKTDLSDALRELAAPIVLLNRHMLDDFGMTPAFAHAAIINQDDAYDGTNQVQLYNFAPYNPSPTYDPVVIHGNYVAGADVYLWANSAAQTNGNQGIFFTYDATDALVNPNTSATYPHGERIFLGYTVDALYQNATDNSIPSPASAWLDPAKHFTAEGKYYIDQALSMANKPCNDSCNISIQQITYDNCVAVANGYEATLQVIINWNMPPIGEDIILTLDGGNPQTIDVSQQYTTDTLQYTVAADGTTNYELIAHFVNDMACADTIQSSVITCSPTSNYDVSLEKTVAPPITPLNSTTTFTISITNNGDAVTDAIVTDALPAGLSYDGASYVASVGTFDGTTWTVGNMAVGATETLDITVTAIAEGIHNNMASIAINETEDDLTNNEDVACVSVPVEICDDGSQGIEATAEDVNGDGTTTYQWYVSNDNGANYTPIDAADGGTAQVYTISQAGYYIYTVNNGTLGNCGEQLCCPIIVETTTCQACPPSLCIPVTIIKTE